MDGDLYADCERDREGSLLSKRSADKVEAPQIQKGTMSVKKLKKPNEVDARRSIQKEHCQSSKKGSTHPKASAVKHRMKF